MPHIYLNLAAIIAIIHYNIKQIASATNRKNIFVILYIAILEAGIEYLSLFSPSMEMIYNKNNLCDNFPLYGDVSAEKNI